MSLRLYNERWGGDVHPTVPFFISDLLPDSNAAVCAARCGDRSYEQHKSVLMLTIEAYNTTSIVRLPLAKMRRAVQHVFEGEGIAEGAVTIVLVDDTTIHEMNKTYLQHDYPTDVITFSLDEEPLSGEIYISAETARNQAEEYGVSVTNELMRLAAHGALHLAGYDDANDEGRAQMRRLEDKYIGV